MDVYQSQHGDALTQPTRARLFSILSDLRRPAPTDELSELLGLHPNGVRSHLEMLQRAGLVDRDRERIARGRPRDIWMISPDAKPSGELPSGYVDLGRWLVRVLVECGVEDDQIESVGRGIGRELIANANANGGTDAEDSGINGSENGDGNRQSNDNGGSNGGNGDFHARFHAALSALGHRPLLVSASDGDDEGRLTYRLRNYPYREVAEELPEVVFRLHNGVTAGMVEALDSNFEIKKFVADSDYESCLIELRRSV